jgi:Mg2+-importing ATPase
VKSEPTGTKPTAELSIPIVAEPAAPHGLTSVEARRRLTVSGPNETGGHRTAGMLRQVAAWLVNPLIVILLAASVLSAALGQTTNALLIGTMVLLSVSLNFFQTYRSNRAVERLRASVAPTATALRDGEWTAIPRRDLVVGDVVRLAAGDLVPADGSLLEPSHVYVQQAALTGESMPVEKNAGGGDEEERIFLGTSVVSGIATAIVTATGRATQLGDIAARLAARPPETEFERGTRRFGLLIMRTVVLLIFFVLLVSLFRRRDPFESLLFAVALAVGLTPEFLPMITSVTLSQGAVRMARRKVIVKHLETIQNFGSIDVLLSDKTGTLTAAHMSLERACDAFGDPSTRVLPLARANSSLHTGIGNPLDEALLASGEGSPLEDRKVAEIPFDFERRRVSVVVEEEGNRLLITKGAPESVLPICIAAEIAGATVSLDAAARRRTEETYRDLSSKGLRVLAVAWQNVLEKPAYGRSDETGLTLAGFVAFADPVMADAPALLETLRRDGVEVKILTGDNELVARRVCADVGLRCEEVVLGADVDRLTDAALGAVAERTSVFARVSPAQKNRILLALKHRGHVVGFLGDGVNDAPSLHAADVGISVSSAVEIARDAAEVILLERSLRVLHEGIIEGRRSFGNVMKYLLMGTSSNFGNMFSMAVAPIFLPYLPMLPTQILLNNFLYDLAQVTIPTDHVDATYVRKPQRWNIGVLRDFMLTIGPISSLFDFLTFFVLLKVFEASEALFHTGWFVESLATQTLVLFVIRTAGNPLRSRPSAPLAITTIAVVVLAVLLPYTPAARALGFEPLPAAFFAFLLAVVGAYLFFVELVKSHLLRRPAPG